MPIPASGNFSLSPQGQLVTQDGLVVQPGIAIPANTLSVTINAQGQVNATVAGNATPQTVGQLELTRFPNEAGLNAVGNNLYLETPGFGFAPGGRAGLAPATAPSSRASWKPRTSTRWTRSPP